MSALHLCLGTDEIARRMVTHISNYLRVAVLNDRTTDGIVARRKVNRGRVDSAPRAVLVTPPSTGDG